MDIDHFDVAREIEVVSASDFEVKFDEAVFEFTSTWTDCQEEFYYNATSGEVMVKDLVEAARKVEMETLKKHGVYEKAPT